MKCKYCGKKLERTWKFCAYCGKERKITDFFKRAPKTPEQEMENMMKWASRIIKLGGFPGKFNIKFNAPGMKNMEIPVGGNQQGIPIPVQKVKQKEEKPRKVKKIIEPITKTTKIAKGLKHVLLIPGVRSPKDIKIRQFEESIEIKAYAKDKAFFKVIPINPNSKIIEKKYQDEMLKLVIS